VRALEPLDGLAVMRRRRGLDGERALCSGPGKLTVALGVELELNQSSLLDGPIAVWARPVGAPEVAIADDRRIGISRAVELPWRFCATGSRYLSRPFSSS
jgi:DNA-3-methyladenine glycosylase